MFSVEYDQYHIVVHDWDDNDGDDDNDYDDAEYGNDDHKCHDDDDGDDDDDDDDDDEHDEDDDDDYEFVAYVDDDCWNHGDRTANIAADVGNLNHFISHNNHNNLNDYDGHRDTHNTNNNIIDENNDNNGWHDDDDKRYKKHHTSNNHDNTSGRDPWLQFPYRQIRHLEPKLCFEYSQSHPPPPLLLRL